MDSFINIVQSNEYLQKRREYSEELVRQFKEKLYKDEFLLKIKDACIYLGGSIGRYEAGEKSDLDFFAISKSKTRRLDEVQLFASLININNQMHLPEFSNDGKYLKIYAFSEHLKAIGSPQDDHDNWFTARMLLMLESIPIFNDTLYWSVIGDVSKLYFRDREGKELNFKPIFLLNDILRYWRTLCLNYEIIRFDKTRPWRKKNINLKFSRRLTVFSTVLYLLAKKDMVAEDLVELVKLTPFMRIASALDIIGDTSLVDEFYNFVEYYNRFLQLKEIEDNDRLKSDIFINIDSDSLLFKKFIYKILHHPSIDVELKECLVV